MAIVIIGHGLCGNVIGIDARHCSAVAAKWQCNSDGSIISLVIHLEVIYNYIDA